MSLNILLVIDGVYRFTDPDVPDFTFVELVNTFQSAGFNVTKAHRDNVTDSGADITQFDFSTANLDQYDEIWMIGYHGRNVAGSSGANEISDAEIRSILEFMDGGGGVFCTGDHDSIGADMCGHIPRIRSMRRWYGAGDAASPMPADFPRNFHPVTAQRADTIQPNPLGDGNIYFENQSDSIPQTITPTSSPAHAVLRDGGSDITIYPDHMHEGGTLGENMMDGATYDWTQSMTFDGYSTDEYPLLEGHRELPQVIATGETVPHETLNATSGGSFPLTEPKIHGVLSTYNGHIAGVGRVVSGATFHHYIDINLDGDSRVDTPAEIAMTGPDAADDQGFKYPGAEATYADIKAVFINIARWIARPKRQIQIVLERSTFGEEEVDADNIFEGAVYVIVDGLKPNQFPGGGITNFAETNISTLENWAPALMPNGVNGLHIEPTSVDSDDPSHADRVQRVTFTYRVRFQGNAAFNFMTDFLNVEVNGLLSPTEGGDLADIAWMQLVKAANPFMLDLDSPNSKTWLSSDVRVFNVVAGDAKFGTDLPANATRNQALQFIRTLTSGMSVADFESLADTQSGSNLSIFPTTTNSGENVYNFAVARVRLNGDMAIANDVRVFFRIFKSQTTAALTYKTSGGNPVEGYLKTSGASPIALPGINDTGNEYISFPFFAANRAASPAAQSEHTTMVKDISPNPGNEVSVFFGCLLDNNLSDPYLPESPVSGGPNLSLADHLMGSHQCLVAQIEFAGTPIPHNSKPSTSDKLSQRNIAFAEIANPGSDASRVASHTFEIEATPHPISRSSPPDELMLTWSGSLLEGTRVEIYIPTWKANDVIELANGLYTRHGIIAMDDHTISIPAGGTRYVPLPRHLKRQIGVMSVKFPLGVKKGQRYDLAVQQITNKSRRVDVEPPKVRSVTKKEAAAFAKKNSKRPKKDVVIVQDMALLDAKGRNALIIETPGASDAAKAAVSPWREVTGAFQLAVPVSVKDDMLMHYQRLLSVLTWRANFVRPVSRWYKPFMYYVQQIADKVQALGGNPFVIPATPDGKIPQLEIPSKGDGDGGTGPDDDGPFDSGQDGLDSIDDWLDGEGGGLRVTGKVSAMIYDHFGDFEGFVVETFQGRHIRLFTREQPILELAKEAWKERYSVTVFVVSKSSRLVRHLVIGGYL